MRKLLLSIVLALLVSKSVFSQDTLSEKPLNKPQLYSTIAAEALAYAGLISYLQFVWYKDHDRVPFHFYNDNKGYLQIDKCGHVYGAYVESYIGYNLLRSAGVTRNKSLIFGGLLGFALQAPIEIFDGLYEGWGFSWGDMAANAAGSGIVIANELIFNEQLVKYKFSYSNSIYAPMANGYLGENTLEKIFYDYNGHTYWLSMPISKMVGKNYIPQWINIAAGYSANGMFGEFKNKRSYGGVLIPETERYRQYLLSLDIDWTRIPTQSKLMKVLLQAMVFIKLPFPAIEFNSKGEFRGYWLYY